MKNFVLLYFIFFLAKVSFGQRTVAITIDDVPNAELYQRQNFTSLLQSKLDSLQIPVAIFINEGNLEHTKQFDKNRDLLKTWLAKNYITVGNHGFAHKNYADAGLEAFKEDVVKGEMVTKQLLNESNKESKYFRFPFNALGNDSTEHNMALKFLKEKQYISTPFTIESEDWLHAILYDDALSKNDKKRAEWIGNHYVDFTLRLFSYFDSLSVKFYNRPIKQIYLCHDNKLNADYLSRIVDELKRKEYRFISLDEAMSDSVYNSETYYFGKAGFSWIYRWIPDMVMRKKLMQSEPANPEIQNAFEVYSRKK